MSALKQLAANPAATVIITEKGIIRGLKGMTEQRFQAISAYPSSKYYRESISVVNTLRERLALADEQLNYKAAVRICLQLENHLMYLAPRSTVKIFNNYKAKLDFYMNACREMLNYQQQGL